MGEFLAVVGIWAGGIVGAVEFISRGVETPRPRWWRRLRNVLPVVLGAATGWYIGPVAMRAAGWMPDVWLGVALGISVGAQSTWLHRVWWDSIADKYAPDDGKLEVPRE